MSDQDKVVSLDSFRGSKSEPAAGVESPEEFLFHLSAMGPIGGITRVQLAITEELDIYSKPDQFSAVATALEGIAAGLREAAAHAEDETPLPEG